MWDLLLTFYTTNGKKKEKNGAPHIQKAQSKRISFAPRYASRLLKLSITLHWS